MDVCLHGIVMVGCTENLGRHRKEREEGKIQILQVFFFFVEYIFKRESETAVSCLLINLSQHCQILK